MSIRCILLSKYTFGCFNGNIFIIPVAVNKAKTTFKISYNRFVTLAACKQTLF